MGRDEVCAKVGEVISSNAASTAAVRGVDVMIVVRLDFQLIMRAVDFGLALCFWCAGGQLSTGLLLIPTLITEM